MKLFVRVISTLILLVYGIENIMLSAGSIYSIVLAIKEMIYGFGATIDGSTTPILDGIGRFFLGVGIFLLVVMILIVAAEIWLMALNYIKAIKEESFEYYRTLSVFSLISGAINIVFVLILLIIFGIIFGNSIYYDSIVKTFENITVIMIGTNIFMGFWSILNLLSAKECVENGW